MKGKIVGIGLVAAGLLAGALLFWLEQFHYFEVTEPGDATLPLTSTGGAPSELPVQALRLAQGASSPLKYRACFEVAPDAPALAAAAPYDTPVPTVAPLSFPCFDADAIAAALRAGSATAYLSRSNQPYGIDRVLAITETGQGYGWHQINRCGERVFDGDPPPEGCPPPPSN